MRVVVELFREDNGRLEGVLELPDGHRDVFVSTLDLLRILEGLDLSRHPEPAADAADVRLSQSLETGSSAEDCDH